MESCDLRSFGLYIGIKFCEPCQYQHTTSEATDFCIDCEESYCQNCARKHHTHKISCGHTLSSINKICKWCEPCSLENKEVPVRAFCVKCQECYCSSCYIHHKSQKCSRNHDIREVSVSDTEVILSLTTTTHASQDKEDLTTEKNEKSDQEEEKRKSTEGESEKTPTYSELATEEKNENSDGNDRERLEEETTHLYRREAVLNEHEKNASKYDETNVINVDSKSIMPSVGTDLDANTNNRKEPEHRSYRDVLICNNGGTKTGYDTENQNHLHEPNAAFSSNPPKGHLTATPGKEERMGQPGKPSADYVQSDLVTLKWSETRSRDKDEIYEILYKEAKWGSWKKPEMPNIFDGFRCSVTGLKPATQYVFKVRRVNQVTGNTGPYSLVSDVIQTKNSPAEQYKARSVLINKGNPSVYRLPLEEDKRYRDMRNKIARYETGHSETPLPSKTILLIGETGTGKSTLVDCFVNYSLGISIEDSFRFTILSQNEDQHRGSNTSAGARKSRNDFITIYTVYPIEETGFPFVLNIIDTPGLGEGNSEDGALLSRVEVLMKIMEKIDIFGLVLKSSDSRLSLSQRSLCDSLLHLFGMPVSENACAFVTFCDNQEPPVVNSLKGLHSTLSLKRYFCFNNCALFASETQDALLKLLWTMGKESFESMLRFVSQIKPKSLTLTSVQLNVREEILKEIQYLYAFFLLGLYKMSKILKDIATVSQIKDEALHVTELVSEVESFRMEAVTLSYQGQVALNCTRCQITCEENCNYSSKSEMKRLPCFKNNQFCRTCRKSCHVSEHKFSSFRWKAVPQKRKETLLMKEKHLTQFRLNEEKRKVVYGLLIILSEMAEKFTRLELKSTFPKSFTLYDMIQKMHLWVSNQTTVFPSNTAEILTILYENSCLYNLQWYDEGLIQQITDDFLKLSA